MNGLELNKFSVAYDLAAMKFLILRGEAQMYRPKDSSKPLPLEIVQAQAKKDEAARVAEEEMKKTSSDYLEARKLFRKELLPSGYREIEMQVDLSSDILCEEYGLEEGEKVSDVIIAAIPEQNLELPLCQIHVFPNSTKGEIKAGKDLLVWDWKLKCWMPWKDSEDFRSFTEVEKFTAIP